MPGWAKTPDDRRRDAATYDHRYRRARQACLKQAAYQCQVRTPGVCTGRATETDHEAGAAADPDHKTLRAVCSPCHARITAQQGGGYRRNSQSPDPKPLPFTAW